MDEYQRLAEIIRRKEAEAAALHEEQARNAEIALSEACREMRAKLRDIISPEFEKLADAAPGGTWQATLTMKRFHEDEPREFAATAELWSAGHSASVHYRGRPEAKDFDIELTFGPEQQSRTSTVSFSEVTHASVGKVLVEFVSELFAV